MLLRWMLAKLIKTGTLTVSVGGGVFTVGGVHPGPAVAISIRDSATARRLALHPDLHLGEAYTDGALVVDSGSIWDLLDLCGLNLGAWGSGTSWFQRSLDWTRRQLQQANARRASRSNVAHHYDLSEEMYRSFLDADMQYSCAYFPTSTTSLEDAQRAKKAHIAAKLALKPGQRVLDIGCGWGGMALYVAQAEDVAVHGITLSQEQLRVCKARAEALGLSDRVSFSLIDYRDVAGPYDRIVSVGMFEHVGTPNYQAFFDRVAALLAPDGVALIHSIGRIAGPASTSSWIHKYIFPGGYVPALSEVVPSIERSGLWLTDLEILRMHYAETLKIWRERFLGAAHRLPAEFDERFRRMWEFYLAASEMSFRHCGFMIFQVQLTRDPYAVPLTRDYMMDEERRLEAAAGALLEPTGSYRLMRS